MMFRLKNTLAIELKCWRGVYRETLSQRGVTTEKHADLNRPSLKRARLLIWKPILDEIKQIISLGDDPRVHTAKQFLSDKCKGQHGSFIKWILQDWGIIDSKGNIDVER